MWKKQTATLFPEEYELLSKKYVANRAILGHETLAHLTMYTNTNLLIIDRRRDTTEFCMIDNLGDTKLVLISDNHTWVDVTPTNNVYSDM